MNEEKIKILLKENKIRRKGIDKEKTKSIIFSARQNSEVALSIKINKKNSTVIFREIYESIRQIGEAMWWLKGYEPLNHDTSLEILKTTKIKNGILLNFLDRFRTIRNDANYRGFIVTEPQAREIILFWKKAGLEIIKTIEAKIK